MEELPYCPICGFLRDSLEELPCCYSVYCRQCLSSRGRCPNCSKVFDIRDCRQYTPLKKVVGEILKKCKHPGCSNQKVCLLLEEHEKKCKFNEGETSELLQAFSEPNNSPAAQFRIRRANIFDSFADFSNIQAYAMKSKKDNNNSSKDKCQQLPENGIVTHMVLNIDTIQGLALKYGTTSEEIKRLNKLRSDDIFTRSSILIPATRMPDFEDIDLETMEKLLEQRLLTRFKRHLGLVDDEEARYYLEATNFDFTAAVRDYRGDMDWESSNPLPLRKREEPTKQTMKKKRDCCILLFSQ